MAHQLISVGACGTAAGMDWPPQSQAWDLTKFSSGGGDTSILRIK